MCSISCTRGVISVFRQPLLNSNRHNRHHRQRPSSLFNTRHCLSLFNCRDNASPAPPHSASEHMHDTPNTRLSNSASDAGPCVSEAKDAAALSVIAQRSGFCKSIQMPVRKLAGFSAPAALTGFPRFAICQASHSR